MHEYGFDRAATSQLGECFYVLQHIFMLSYAVYTDGHSPLPPTELNLVDTESIVPAIH